MDIQYKTCIDVCPFRVRECDMYMRDVLECILYEYTVHVYDPPHHHHHPRRRCGATTTSRRHARERRRTATNDDERTNDDEEDDDEPTMGVEIPASFPRDEVRDAMRRDAGGGGDRGLRDGASR